VRGATRLVTERIEGRWTVVRIAAALRVSTQRLQRAFQRETGLSAHAFLDAQRRERAAQALQAGASVRRAAQAAGFSSPQALYRKAGMTAFPPSVPRPIPKDLAIHYGIYESTMGTILIARTARGLCAVRFGLDARSLERELRKEFPAATLLPETRDDDWRVQEILQRVAGQPPGRSLPQDVRATAFQRRVWDALQSIPHGTTTTYGALARSIGRPSAVRAVARACATNPLAVVVPCHRVVASNGSLAGYRWGLSRKKRLLAKEADVRNE
jgi:AraC family transcriptional regulator, regulatory protein of adaptative response / methylated-DNA-[protein]-cysteine methyltransferase